MSDATPIVLLAHRMADLTAKLEIATEEGDRETERALHREALWLETSIATAPAADLNDVGLKLLLLLGESLCGGISEQVRPHHIQAIRTAMAYLAHAQGIVSEKGRAMLHMDAVSTFRGPGGELPQ